MKLSSTVPPHAAPPVFLPDPDPEPTRGAGMLLVLTAVGLFWCTVGALAGFLLARFVH